MLHQTTEMHLLCSLGSSFHLPPPKRLLAASFQLAFIFKGPSGLASPSLCPKLLRNCCYSALLSHFYIFKVALQQCCSIVVDFSVQNMFSMLDVKKCQIEPYEMWLYFKKVQSGLLCCWDLCLDLDAVMKPFIYHHQTSKKSRWKALKITSFFMLALSSPVLQLDSVRCTTQTDLIIVSSYLRLSIELTF